MHALYFLRRKGKTIRQESPTCDEKRGEEKGEMDQDKKWRRKTLFDNWVQNNKKGGKLTKKLENG